MNMIKSNRRTESLYNHLSFYVRLTNKDNDHRLLSTTPFGSKTILNRIMYLHWTGAYRSRYIPQYLKNNATQFTQLRSLVILRIRPSQTSLFIEILPTLNVLEYLSIKCKIIRIPIAIIFNSSSLRMCELDGLLRVEYTTNFVYGHSNLEVLNLVNIFPIDESIITKMLLHMPKLKRLEISGRSWALEELGAWIVNQSKICPKLPIFKIIYRSTWIRGSLLEWLRSVMFFVKRLHIDITVTGQEEMLLQNLINKWWPTIEKIDKVFIRIRVYNHVNKLSSDMQRKFDIFRKTLLDKNDQGNGRFNLKWTETEEYQNDQIYIEFTTKT